MPEPELSEASASGLPERIHSILHLAGLESTGRMSGGPRWALRMAAASSQERALQTTVSLSGACPVSRGGWSRPGVGSAGEGASETRSVRGRNRGKPRRVPTGPGWVAGGRPRPPIPDLGSDTNATDDTRPWGRFRKDGAGGAGGVLWPWGLVARAGQWVGEAQGPLAMG